VSRPHLLLLAAGLLSGCGFLGSGEHPLELAFRGGAGLWPENSRVAIDNSLAMQFDGLELDVAVTADEVPVFHRAPTLTPGVCESITGLEFSPDEVVIADLAYADLEDLYRCGGTATADYPDAATAQDTITPMEWLMEGLADGNSGLMVHLNVPYDEAFSLDRESTARAILDTWFLTDPGNRWYISTNDADLIAALDAHAVSIGRAGEVTTSLVWPDADGFGGSASTDLALTLGVADPVAEVRSANADGVVLTAGVADREMVRKLHAAGFDVQVWDADGKARTKALERWPVDAVLTAFPGDGGAQ